MPGLEGKMLDRFRVVEQVGQGGMATVYRAYDTRERKDVALKVLSPTISGDKQFVRRFRREASMLARLKHPGIVPVIGYGEAQGFVYLAMPFIVGDTLLDRIDRRRMSGIDATRWIYQISEALQFAHDQGIIHRDVKPANVLIDKEGNARLTDFGLARLVEAPSSLTGSMLMGTPAFVSPEQVKGLPLDPRSDQYSLGVVLFLMATDRLPFEAESPMTTALMHVQEPVPRPAEFRPDIQPAVERVILKALAKNPDERFSSVAELNRAYQAAMAGKPVDWVELPTEVLRARPASTVGRADKRSTAPRRRGGLGIGLWLATLGALASVVAALAMYPAIVERLRAQAILPPSSSSPAAPPTMASSATTLASTDTPAPSPTATAVVSQSCPDLSMIGFTREGSRVSWVISNQGEAPIQITGIDVVEIPGGNLPVSISIGQAELLSPEMLSTAQAGGQIEIPVVAEMAFDPGVSRRLAIGFVYSIEESGYRLKILFSNGCQLETTW